MSKKFVFIFLSSFLMFLFLTILGNYLVDPYQLFRKEKVCPDFSLEERFLLPGLARHYEKDCVIIGTSLTLNFSPSYYEKLTGLKTLKLSMSASTFLEQVMLLKLALKSKQVKEVIWEFNLDTPGNVVRKEYGSFPYYMYTDFSYDKINYLFNIDVIKHTFKKILNSFKKNNSFSIKNELDRRGFFYHPTGRNNVFEKSSHNIKEATINYSNINNQISRKECEVDFYKEQIYFISNNIVPLIKENKNIHFNIFFAPVSILHHKLSEMDGVFSLKMDAKIKIIKLFYDLDNVSMFDFQTEKRIIEDFNNYSDQIHFKQDINNYIMLNIYKKINLITKKNYLDNIQKLKSLVQHYDFLSSFS